VELHPQVVEEEQPQHLLLVLLVDQVDQVVALVVDQVGYLEEQVIHLQ
jgi:hypothetical protein